MKRQKLPDVPLGMEKKKEERKKMFKTRMELDRIGRYSSISPNLDKTKPISHINRDIQASAQLLKLLVLVHFSQGFEMEGSLYERLLSENESFPTLVRHTTAFL